MYPAGSKDFWDESPVANDTSFLNSTTHSLAPVSDEDEANDGFEQDTDSASFMNRAESPATLLGFCDEDIWPDSQAEYVLKQLETGKDVSYLAHQTSCMSQSEPANSLERNIMMQENTSSTNSKIKWEWSISGPYPVYMCKSNIISTHEQGRVEEPKPSAHFQRITDRDNTTCSEDLLQREEESEAIMRTTAEERMLRQRSRSVEQATNDMGTGCANKDKSKSGENVLKMKRKSTKLPNKSIVDKAENSEDVLQRRSGNKKEPYKSVDELLLKRSTKLLKEDLPRKRSKSEDPNDSSTSFNLCVVCNKDVFVTNPNISLTLSICQCSLCYETFHESCLKAEEKEIKQIIDKCNDTEWVCPPCADLASKEDNIKMKCQSTEPPNTSTMDKAEYSEDMLQRRSGNKERSKSVDELLLKRSDIFEGDLPRMRSKSEDPNDNSTSFNMCAVCNKDVFVTNPNTSSALCVCQCSLCYEIFHESCLEAEDKEIKQIIDKCNDTEWVCPPCDDLASKEDNIKMKCQITKPPNTSTMDKAEYSEDMLQRRSGNKERSKSVDELLLKRSTELLEEDLPRKRSKSEDHNDNSTSFNLCVVCNKDVFATNPNTNLVISICQCSLCYETFHESCLEAEDRDIKQIIDKCNDIEWVCPPCADLASKLCVVCGEKTLVDSEKFYEWVSCESCSNEHHIQCLPDYIQEDLGKAKFLCNSCQ